MRKLYFDNEYNDCTCAVQRADARVPAEKPFESRPKRKKKREGERTRRRSEGPKKRRQEKYEEAPPAYQRGYCSHPCAEPQYKPALKLSFERSDVDARAQNQHLPCANQRDVQEVPRRRSYPSSSTDSPPHEPRRTLAGQYPCNCMQAALRYETSGNAGYFPQCHCGCQLKNYGIQTQPPSRGKRAWELVKSKTRNMFKSATAKRRAEKRERQRHHDALLKSCYESCGSPYVYPYAVRFAGHAPCCEQHRGPKNRSRAVATHQEESTVSSAPEDTSRSGSEEERRRRELPREPPRFFDRANCCCVCDVDFCECKCCCGGGCDGNYVCELHQNTQTSLQNIMERFTQTDFPKRCCRCCRCCGKRPRGPCPDPALPEDRPEHPATCPRCDPCAQTDGPCPRAKNFVCPARRGAPQAGNAGDLPTKEVFWKTQMVRANSVQCIPASENKATSCDERFTATIVDDLLKDLWDGKPEKKFPVYRNEIEWTGDLLSRMSFGRNRDSRPHEVGSTPRLGGIRLPKPLDPNDKRRTWKRSCGSFGEHSRIVSAICDAILSRRDDESCIGNSELLYKDDLSSDQDLRKGATGPKEARGARPRVLSRIVSKPRFLKSKRPSVAKQTSFVDNAANVSVTRTGLIPARTTKKPPVGKRIATISEAAATPRNENRSEASNLEGIDRAAPNGTGVKNERRKGDLPPIDYDRLKHLDFSGIRFSKPATVHQRGFVLNSLPSYSTSISNEHRVRSLLFAPPWDPFENASSSVGSADLVNVENTSEEVDAERKIELLLAEIERRRRERSRRDVEFFGKKT